LSTVHDEIARLQDDSLETLLSKLTLDNYFEPVSDQIVAWVNRSESEKDASTLRAVTQLVYEQAIADCEHSETYARMCRTMVERISPKVQEVGVTDAEGKPIAGGRLFTKYLLNRCQDDFERVWSNKDVALSSHAATTSEKDALGPPSGDKSAVDQSTFVNTKRQQMGVIKLVAELFKVQMLTERVMHECVKKLLGKVGNPGEPEIESLCMLLTTVGSLIDTPKARAHMDIYFSRMKELTKSPNLNSRMCSAIQVRFTAVLLAHLILILIRTLRTLFPYVRASGVV
jgi:translation initiation factor 4G